MQKAGEPENDVGFTKHNYSQLNCSCIPVLANRPGISGTVPDFALLSRRPGNANYCPGNWVNRRDRKLGVGALAIHARPKRAPDQN